MALQGCHDAHISINSSPRASPEADADVEPGQLMAETNRYSQLQDACGLAMVWVTDCRQDNRKSGQQNHRPVLDPVDDPVDDPVADMVEVG